MKKKHFKVLRAVIVYILIFICNYNYGQEINNTISTISGYISPYKDSIANVTLKLLKDTGTTSFINRCEVRTKLLDGHFRFDIPCDGVKFVSLYLNDKNILIKNIGFAVSGFFIEQGDSIHFNISDFGIENIVSSGKGHEKFDLALKFHNFKMNEAKTKQMETNLYKRAKVSFNQIDSIQNIISTYRNIINKHTLEIISSDYITKSLESLLRDKYLYDPNSEEVKLMYNLLLEREDVFTSLLKHSPKDALQIARLNFVLEDFAYFVLAQQQGKPQDGKPNPQKIYAFLDDFYKDTPIKNYILYSFLYRYISKYGLTDGVNKDVEAFLSQTVQDGLHYERLNNRPRQEYLKGEKALNFALPDTSGKIHQLSDFEGKVVVIDLWFTGCVGCAYLSKILNEIEEEYKDDEIVFISINVDNSIERWKSGIGTFSSLKSLQLNTKGFNRQTPHPFVLENKVYSYPTLIMIDKGGKYIYNRAPNPLAEFESFSNAINLALQ